MKTGSAWVVAGVLLALIAAAYSNSFVSGFVGDNKALILQDPRVQSATGANVREIFERSYWWPTGEAGIHRPFTKLTYLFNYAVLGNRDRPAGYHVLNLLLHLGNVWLVYLLGLRLLGDWRPAAALAGLWGVHPVLTESVTNMVGRADLLAGSAVLGGLLLYLKSAERRRWAWLGALFVVALAGMFSKESAAVVAGVLVLHEVVWGRRWKALAWGLAATVAPLALMWVQRSGVLERAGHAEFPLTDNPIAGADWLSGRLTAVNVLVRGLGLMVWPGRLSADYSYNQIPLATGNVTDWLAVAAVCAGMVLLCRWSRLGAFFAGFALLTYLPSSNLLFPIGTVMAERLLYLPAAGVLGLAVAAGWQLAPRKVLLPVAVVVGICLAGRTWVRNQDWRNDLTLAQASVAASPESYKSHMGLGLALYGADEGHSRLDEAIAEFEKSVAILDGVPDADNNAETYLQAASLMLYKGDRLVEASGGGEPGAEAKSQYRRARAVLQRGDAIVQAANRAQNERHRNRPDLVGPPNAYANLYRALAAVHLRLGEHRESVERALYARTLAPLAAEASRQLALSYAGSGEGERAAVTLLGGIILTSDASLRDDVVELYRSGLDREGCAVRGAELNAACPLVHAHLCAAAADVLDLLERTGRAAETGAVRRMAREQMGCEGAR